MSGLGICIRLLASLRAYLDLVFTALALLEVALIAEVVSRALERPVKTPAAAPPTPTAGVLRLPFSWDKFNGVTTVDEVALCTCRRLLRRLKRDLSENREVSLESTLPACVPPAPP